MTIKVTYNVTDVYVTQDVSPVYINVSYSTGTSGGSAVWGGITGTLSDQTDLQTALDLKVPYTGATANVNLGEYEIKAGQVTLDTSPTGMAAVGTTRWNDTTGLSETTLKGGTVVLKNGVDLVARVVNKVSPNTTLTKAAYQAVRVSGAQGQRLAVAFAQANNDNNSADTIGLVTETIATNQEGFIITVGQLENINTTGSLQGETWADGDVLYLSPTTAGALTNVKPTGATGHIVVIGYVEYAHANNGKIYVKVMNGWELDELHNLNIVSPANNQSIFYNSSNQLWENKSIATALGYTPANAATTLTINGVTYDLSTSRTWTVSAGISGSGASGQVAYWTGTSAQSGSNNLFWDNATNRLGIGTNTPATIIDAKGDRATVTITDTNSGGANPTFFGAFADFLQLSVNRNPSTGIFAQTGKATSQISLEGAANTSSIRFFATNTNNTLPDERLRLYGSGNLLIQSGGTYSDGGQRLQVQGTTLLNGNVTFSSATGMFWDAANSRLGIGTNAPSSSIHISGFNTTNSQFRLGSLEFQSYGLNNGWFGNNVYYNGTNFIRRATGTAEYFYFFNGSGQFRFAPSGNAGTTITNGVNGAGLIPFVCNVNGDVFIGGDIDVLSNTSGGLNVKGNTRNVLINSTTDSGERLQVTGTMKVTGNVAVDTNTLFVDTTNKRIGVRTATPSAGIDVWNNSTTELGQYRLSDSRVTIPNYSSVGFSPALTTNTLSFISAWTSSTGGVQLAGFTSATNTGSPFVFVGYHGGTAPTTAALKFIGFKHDGGTNRTALTGNEIIAGFSAGVSADVFQVKANGRINMSSLPTSSTGLATGDLWNDAGTIKIV